MDFERDGLYLVGEFLGLRNARPRKWTDRNGVEHEGHPVDARVLTGTSVQVVQFPDRESALAAIGGASERERVAIRCFNRYGVKGGEVWQFYAGPRLREDDEASSDARVASPSAA